MPNTYESKKKKKNPKEIDRLLNKERCIKKNRTNYAKVHKRIDRKVYKIRIEMEHN